MRRHISCRVGHRRHDVTHGEIGVSLRRCGRQRRAVWWGHGTCNRAATTLPVIRVVRVCEGEACGTHTHTHTHTHTLSHTRSHKHASPPWQCVPRNTLMTSRSGRRGAGEGEGEGVDESSPGPAPPFLTFLTLGRSVAGANTSSTGKHVLSAEKLWVSVTDSSAMRMGGSYSRRSTLRQSNGCGEGRQTASSHRQAHTHTIRPARTP